MGAITKKAKEISTPRIIYQTESPSPTIPPTVTPERQASETRRKNLLSRDRGRYGTVQTGFRGLLSLASNIGRKTLLGE